MRKTMILASVLLAFLFGCTRIETEYVDVEKDAPVTPLASYNFDNKSYSVHTLIYSENEEYLEFLIAREPVAPFTSYMVLCIMKDHLGKKIDFSDYSLMNRIDYMVIFEDTKHYYPSEYAPKNGNMTIKKSGKGYSIDFDAKYIDGKPISFKYDGEFAKAED
ncbi:MAG: hypothetical protein MJZ16_13045 [Bacteroidales bacterium]|nr:hypothetical protein [Bacteroidales bacterium]